MSPLDIASRAGAQSSKQDLGFLTPANIVFLTQLYKRYLKNPENLDPGWLSFFASMGDEADVVFGEWEGPSWAKPKVHIEGPANDKLLPKAVPDIEEARAAVLDSMRAIALIRAYRVLGHRHAKLDPLELVMPPAIKELDPAFHGFGEDDYSRPIFVNGILGFQTATLNEILARLRNTYCAHVGVEFMHIQEPEQKKWIQERIESWENHTDFTDEGQKAIYGRLVDAEHFEAFLDKKFRGTKRFGLDGGESMIPALEQILKRGSQLGIKEIVIGMPHRGRLNVLCNVMGKSAEAIFSEFLGASSLPEDEEASGDVKYHLGTSSDREFDGNKVHLSLSPNPSHLEAVNPVVAGKVRAKQAQRNDTERRQVLGLLLHGDAAFAGQGLVPETLDMAELRGYRIGGTIHFIVNNQIGFTTNPVNSRSGPYCTDVAKMIAAPIFHVNGDDPEAVVHVARIATEFRQQFGKDVVIDMFCYRRFGHNEGDEPRFSQPLMYKRIAEVRPVRQKFRDHLVKRGTLTEGEAEKIVTDKDNALDEAFRASKSYRVDKADVFGGFWAGKKKAAKGVNRGKTAISKELFAQIGKALSTVPKEFNLNTKLRRLLDAKASMFKAGEGFDWATAEALAFASLLAEKYPIRFSGQDVRRGTFSQRHAVLIDQSDESVYIPLNNVAKGQAELDIVNSPLSEAAVLGFEYGYSITAPDTLVLWEAQFGDFVNGAQILIDQFISSAEQKWLRYSGIVMLLPHGYEGQGPEHSSARIERFLQSSARNNWQVLNCTTPANYFHALRRQIHRDFRKPLILFTPKSLLRHKACVSSESMFLDDQSFHRVLHDDCLLCAKKDCRRVVFCTGKVYYDLLAAREEAKIKDVVILRIEQLYPFPKDALLDELKGYEHAEFVWAQEEPRNMGAWSFIDPCIEETLLALGAKHSRAGYAGRLASSSPATGQPGKHQKEQKKLIEEALSAPISRALDLEEF